MGKCLQARLNQCQSMKTITMLFCLSILYEFSDTIWLIIFLTIEKCIGLRPLIAVATLQIHVRWIFKPFLRICWYKYHNTTPLRWTYLKRKSYDAAVGFEVWSKYVFIPPSSFSRLLLISTYTDCSGRFPGSCFPRGLDPIHVKMYVCCALVQHMCAWVCANVWRRERGRR